MAYYIVAPIDFNRPPYVVPNTDQEDTGGDLTAYLNENEREQLIKLMGVTLYGSFVEGLEALPSVWDAEEAYVVSDQVTKGNYVYTCLADNTGENPETQPAFWEVEELPNRWLALLNGDRYTYNGKVYYWDGMKKMLVPYLFSKWADDNAQVLTGSGTVEGKNENSKQVGPSRLISKAYSDFGSRAGAFKDKKNSLYGYLFSFTSTSTFDDSFDESFTNFASYLNYFFVDPGSRNIFGL
jgi:hypothetical protein